MKNFITPLILTVGIFCGSLTTLYVNPHISSFKVVNNQKVEITQKKEVPLTLSIASLGIKTPIESVGQDSQGRMAVPQDENNVGWYMLGPELGQKGSAVIAGHYDSHTGPAIFYNLSDLKEGDEVSVTTNKGKTYTFVVVTKEIYPDISFPIKEVFGKDDIPRLNLITCNGIFDRTAKNYSDRIVVYTELKK